MCAGQVGGMYLLFLSVKPTFLAIGVGSYNWKERNAAIGTNRSFREL
jgi:hypothetical protein